MSTVPDDGFSYNRSMAAPPGDDLFGLLGAEMLRIQQLTGIAPVEPENPVYPQHHTPRIEQAQRQLTALGYRASVDLEATVRKFEVEAGLPPLGRLHQRVWDALQELGSDEAPVHPEKWRTSTGWKPAMRRAIRTKSQRLGLASPVPLMFSDSDSDEPPSPEESRIELHEFSLYTHRNQANEDDLVRALLDTPERSHSEELALLGVDPKLDDDGEDTVDADTDMPLSFGLLDRIRSLKQLFHSVIQKPIYRCPPTPEHDARLLPQLANLFENKTSNLEGRWQAFVGRSADVWQHLERSRGWLHGSVECLEDVGDDLEHGLSRLIGKGGGIIGRVGRYGHAAITNLFRVTYHQLAGVFADIHNATAFVVDTLKTGAGLPHPYIDFRRRYGQLTCFVDSQFSAFDTPSFVADSRTRNQRFELACEVVGTVLNIFVKAGFGVLTAGPAIVALTRAAPKILELTRELRALKPPR